MAPLLSKELESVYPVYSISCADVLADFTARKAEHKSPFAGIAEIEQVSSCFSNTMEKLSRTPCADIQQAYQECLTETEKRVPCLPLRTKLEECTAKHIGKLD